MNNSPARTHFYAIGGGKPRRLPSDWNALMDQIQRDLFASMEWDGKRWQPVHEPS